MASLRYLLDTNVVSAIMKDPHGTPARRLSVMERGEFGISIVVACELQYGVARKQSPRLTAQLEAILEGIDLVPMDAGTEQHSGEIRAALERAGLPIGHNDLLIAAHARALDVTLVTANTSEFERVEHLSVENWQA